MQEGVVLCYNADLLAGPDGQGQIGEYGSGADIAEAHMFEGDPSVRYRERGSTGIVNEAVRLGEGEHALDETRSFTNALNAMLGAPVVPPLSPVPAAAGRRFVLRYNRLQA